MCSPATLRGVPSRLSSKAAWMLGSIAARIGLFANFDQALDSAVKIVGVSDDHDQVARCEKDAQQALGNRASAARSQPYYLDITHPDANKGTVVKTLSRLLSIPISEIATIGDMPNDVLMFRSSGLGIAMGNASPEVQAQADKV